MGELKDNLVQLIETQDLSAIESMSKQLGIEEEEVRVLIEELLSEGRLEGRLTEDGTRFFKAKVEVSDAPIIPKEESEPEFLTYDIRPGKYTAIVGMIIALGAIVMFMTAQGDLQIENFASILLGIGILVVLTGCYWIGRRKTPS
ncbi:MAG: hypothetical protein ACW97A_04705 [Candidatus Thorarchaeota archaeon]